MKTTVHQLALSPYLLCSITPAASNPDIGGQLNKRQRLFVKRSSHLRDYRTRTRTRTRTGFT